jgi:hypothetical protein
VTPRGPIRVGLGEGSRVPWVPELFSAQVLARLEDRRREKLVAVPYFTGFAGETDALIHSFAGEPQLHYPFRGRVKGARAFPAYVTEPKDRGPYRTR